MTDIATGFVQAIEAFLNTRLGDMTENAWKDTGPFLSSITTFSKPEIKPKFDQLKADIEAMEPIFKALGEKIKKQTELISKMVKEASADLDADDFSYDQAARVAIRIAMALGAADEAYNIIATELAKDAGGNVDQTLRSGLMGLWNPWAMPFKNLGSGAGNLLNAFGEGVLGIEDLVDKLSKSVELDRTGGQFTLVAKLSGIPSVAIPKVTPLVRLDEVSFEAFLLFSDREIANPTESEKSSLVERDGKFYIAADAIIGIRLRTKLKPGLTEDKLLAKLMPGSAAPETQTITAISLDTAQGFYLGDGRGNERAVLPMRLTFPGVELREVAFGILRNPAREFTGFELTTSIAAKMGDAVGMQVVGAGFVVDMDGVVDHHAMFADLPVTPRWPDAIGLRIQAGPITGGGFIQRGERTYKVGGQDIKRVEFGGVVQLKVLKLGISAIVVLAPDPFSLVLVIGVRFPTAIDLSMGFTLNGVGGILALNRGMDLDALQEGMKSHVLDKMLFPDDPVKEAPTLLDSVAHIFPPREGGFVIGPIVELGWGSQAKFVKLKVGVVIALPDPKIVILGALRVQVPSEAAPITDIRADVFAAITADYFKMFASMSGSKIAGFSISGDIGLFIGWTGEAAFELSVGGFHPDYAALVGTAPKLGKLTPITIDLSPGGHDKDGKGKGPVTLVIKAYFAITAGSVQLGVDGRLNADFAVIAARAWVTLDMIFIWSPRFAFKIALEVGVEVDLLGFTFAKVILRGSLEGTSPFKLAGHITIDVWFLPTFDEDLGPITWGDAPPPLLAKVDALAVLKGALDLPEAWKVTLPGHAAELVTLAEVSDVDGVIAHPLAGIEVSQAHVPVGVKIAHIGSSPVKADMVMMGAPSTDAGGAAAVSELKIPFPPGHFFDLEGEKLLARAGFEDMTGGYRVAMATTPLVGTVADASRAEGIVSYRTYVRNDPEPSNLRFGVFRGVYVGGSVLGRAAKVSANPYLQPTQEPLVSVLPPGASVLADAATGAPLLADLGTLTATQAAVIGDALRADAAADTTRLTVRG